MVMEQNNHPLQDPERHRPSDTILAPKKITLTVLSPNTTEIPHGRVVFSNVPVTTSLSELKDRLCQEVSSCPQPDRQRLIYRGRPLLDGNATLLEVFALELSSPESPSAFSIHLVLPPPDASDFHQPPRSTSAPPRQAQNAPQNAPNNPQNGIHQAGLRGGATDHAASMHAQQQLAQQIANEITRGQLEWLQRMNQDLIPQGALIQQVGNGFLPQGFQLPAQAQGPQAPGFFPHQQHPPLRPNMPLPYQASTNVQAQQGGNPTAISNPPGGNPHASMASNSQPSQQANPLQSVTRTFPVSGQSSERNGGTSDNPLHTPSSEPTAQSISGLSGQQTHGQAPQTPNSSIPAHTTIQETVGPNGERRRTVISEQTFNLSMQTRTSTPPQFQRPGSFAQANQNRSSTPHRPPENISDGPPNVDSQNRLPQNLLNPTINGSAPIGVPFTGLQHGAVSNTNSSTTTAWLLNGPSGPQGFLFSPEHGYFSSPPNGNSQNSRAAAMRPFMQSRRIRPQHQLQPQSQPQGQAQGQSQPQRPIEQAQNPNANIAVRAPLVQPQDGQRQQEQRNLLNFARDRAWLFVRLYFLTMIFSGYGTWLRIVLLVLTVLWCVLPETTFFQDVGRRIQRHLEDLLPLAPQPRRGNQNQGEQPRQNGGAPEIGNNAAQQGSSGNARPRTPTPEEVAERIRREHQAGQASWLGDAFTRIERAVALFLASLIPGIGERHIQARNEIAEAEQRAEVRRGAQEIQQRPEGEASLEGGTSGQEESNTNTRVETDNSAADTTSGEATAVASAVEGQGDGVGDARHRGRETGAAVDV